MPYDFLGKVAISQNIPLKAVINKIYLLRTHLGNLKVLRLSLTEILISLVWGATKGLNF